MLLQSSSGLTGDQVSLISPLVSIETITELTFYYNMWLDSSDKVGALNVYIYSEFHTYDSNVFSASGNQGSEWRKASICLPPGTYSLAFVGTIGMRYLSDIAIDSVSLNPDTLCVLDKTISLHVGGIEFRSYVVNLLN